MHTFGAVVGVSSRPNAPRRLWIYCIVNIGSRMRGFSLLLPSQLLLLWNVSDFVIATSFLIFCSATLYVCSQSPLSTEMASQTIAVINGTSRTFKHLIPQALARGYKVRAVVRSASRFLDQTKKSDDLSAHEWKDFNDIATLMDILDGVDVVYVALGASAGCMHSNSHNSLVLLFTKVPHSYSETLVSEPRRCHSDWDSPTFSNSTRLSLKNEACVPLLGSCETRRACSPSE